MICKPYFSVLSLCADDGWPAGKPYTVYPSDYHSSQNLPAAMGSAIKIEGGKRNRGGGGGEK